LKEDIQKLHDPFFFGDHAESVLPERLTFLLSCTRIRTIGNLCDKTEADLMMIPRFGARSLENVNRTLRALGLKLKE
jgi:DNA-directed RNA polymerase alpha subunit